jgi:hypothetical protein
MSKTRNGRAVQRFSAALIAAGVMAAAGCSVGERGVSSVPTSFSIGAGSAVAAGAAATRGVDACRLLTDAEVAAVIGSNDGGKGDNGSCSWENTDNYHSVSVDIGEAGTAAGGKLPDPLPGAKVAAGPNGIRFSSGNLAEFLIGDRACQIQVVTSVTDQADRPTAVKLIALIRSRVAA